MTRLPEIVDSFTVDEEWKPKIREWMESLPDDTSGAMNANIDRFRWTFRNGGFFTELMITDATTGKKLHLFPNPDNV